MRLSRLSVWGAVVAIPIPFVGPAYTLDSLAISCQRCLNWYPEVTAFDSKTAVALKPRPGLRLFSSPPGNSDVLSADTGTIRSLYNASNGRFFVVCGDVVSEIYSNGTTVTIGALTSSTGIVRMVDNGLQLIVVDGSAGLGYIFTFATDTFAVIVDAGYPGGTHVAFIDQYFLVNRPGTQQYQWCALTDGTSWPGLNIASDESSPDIINSHIALGGELWIFGPQSYAVHYNTGLARGTFARIPGSNNGVGNVAPHSLARSDTNVFWIGGDDGGQGRVYMNEGYQARPISTLAIDQEIQRYSKIDDAIGYTYQKLGHEFYVLNFPTPSKTWVYDITTGLWHEECWTDEDSNQYMVRGIVQDFAFGKVLVGDWRSNSVFEVDPDAHTDDGDLIHRERSSPHIWANMDRSFYTSFQLDVENGVGLVSGQGEDPQIMLQISNDGGRSWGSEKWRSAGKLGEYKKRVIWNRLGTSRNRIFRIKCTDPVKWVVLGAFIEVE